MVLFTLIITLFLFAALMIYIVIWGTKAGLQAGRAIKQKRRRREDDYE